MELHLSSKQNLAKQHAIKNTFENTHRDYRTSNQISILVQSETRPNTDLIPNRTKLVRDKTRHYSHSGIARIRLIIFTRQKQKIQLLELLSTGHMTQLTLSPLLRFNKHIYIANLQHYLCNKNKNSTHLDVKGF